MGLPTCRPAATSVRDGPQGESVPPSSSTRRHLGAEAGALTAGEAVWTTGLNAKAAVAVDADLTAAMPDHRPHLLLKSDCLVKVTEAVIRVVDEPPAVAC